MSGWGKRLSRLVQQNQGALQATIDAIDANWSPSTPAAHVMLPGCFRSWQTITTRCSPRTETDVVAFWRQRHEMATRLRAYGMSAGGLHEDIFRFL
jgi:hypothetical protein